MEKIKPSNLNSHDTFFKGSFSYPDVAKTYIRSFLPIELVEKLDLENMVMDKNSYISSELKEHFSDLVWNCPYKDQTLKITFLFEHKSTPVRFPHLQLLRYMMGIWESQLKSKVNKYLEPIVPIILYNGRRKWKIKSLSSYFGNIGAELIQYLPIFKYELTDLHQESEEKLLNLQSSKLIISMLALQYYRDIKSLSSLIHSIKDELDGLEFWDKNQNFVNSFMVYLYEYNNLNLNDMQKILRKPRLIDGIKSTYDQILDEGFEKGIEQGIEQGIEKGIELSIRRMLEKGFDNQIVASTLEVPVEIVEKIKLSIK